MSKDENIRKPNPLRWVVRVGVSLLLVVLIGGALAWLLRTQIAETYVGWYCDQRGLECEADVSRIGFSHAEVTSVSVRSKGRQALSSGKITANYSWPGGLQPKIGAVSINDLVLNAGFDGTRLDLRGLERFSSGSQGGESSPIPLSIENGRVILTTPAGELHASVDISGELPRAGKAHITIDPAEIRSGEDHLQWTKGEAILTIEDSRVTGTADVEIQEAVLGDLNVRAAHFTAALAGSDAAPVVTWRGDADTLGYAGRTIKSMSTHGEAQLSKLPGTSLPSVLAALEAIIGEVSAGTVNIGGAASEAMTLTADLSHTGDEVSGPIAFTANTVTSLTGLAETVSATGTLRLNPANAEYLEFDGSGVLKGASIYAPRRKSWLSQVRLPEPYAPHGLALRAAVDKALSKFSSGADIEFVRNADIWSLAASRPTALQSASGMTISVEPDAKPEWLLLNNDGLTLSGEVIATGGGSPTIRTRLSSALMQPDLLRVDATSFKIDPWTHDGRSLTLGLAPFFLESTPQRIRIKTKGDVTVGGALSGAKLKPTTLSGGFEATRGVEGWRVQTSGGACLDLKTLGIASGALSLQAVELKICPESGRFVREVDGKPTGTLALGDIRLPFETGGSSGELNLQNSSLNWQLGDQLRTQIEADKLLMPLNLTSGALSIDGEAPRVTVLTGDGPLKFVVDLGASDFGGDLIPAHVSAAGFNFTGRSTSSGVEGVMKSSELLIEDYRDDPIYKPLQADLTAELKDGQIKMTGPLKLQKSGRTIADAAMELSLETLSGTAKLTGAALTFTPNGLQPYDLSDLLRAALPNARGSLTGNAAFTITSGNLAGTGSVKLDNLGFDTFRIGSIDGVSGKIVFSDIIGLTTLPDQIVSIGSLDPGVRLRNGRLAFQMIGGRLLQLEGARWPFAGGELLIAPTSWQFGNTIQLVTITAEKVELAALLEALSLNNDFSAEGTVSGTFPLEFNGANAFIRNAVLKADEKGGKLAYLGNSLDPAKGQSEISDYAIAALKDFRFRVLEIGVDGNLTDDIIVSIGLYGRNPQVLDGKEFAFNISVDSKLAQLIRSAQSAASGDYITTLIKEQIMTEKSGVSEE